MPIYLPLIGLQIATPDWNHDAISSGIFGKKTWHFGAPLNLPEELTHNAGFFCTKPKNSVLVIQKLRSPKSSKTLSLQVNSVLKQVIYDNFHQKLLVHSVSLIRDS